MDKKTKTYIGGLAFIAAIVIAAYFFYYKPLGEQKASKQKEIDDLKDSIRENEAITKSEKKELAELIVHFKEIDDNVAEQIAAALIFFGMGKPEEAIRKLGVLAETLMEQLYSESKECENWLKKKGKPYNMTGMLLYCKEEDKKINSSEYGALFYLKEMRNEESHNINVKFEPYIQKSGLIVAIGAIKKLSELCYLK